MAQVGTGLGVVLKKGEQALRQRAEGGCRTPLGPRGLLAQIGTVIPQREATVSQRTKVTAPRWRGWLGSPLERISDASSCLGIVTGLE